MSTRDRRGSGTRPDRIAPAAWADVERLTQGQLSRRHFLQLAAASAGAVASGPILSACTPAVPAFPFTLGIASGDPLADRVILWTRLAPDPINGGGMPQVPVNVIWEVANDEAFSVIVRSGVAVAHPSLGHSVHVDVPGLDPDRWYYYRFVAGGYVSDVGRTRTFPAAGSAPSLLRFASCSCQRYTDGFFTAFANMAEEDLDCVVHLGDYIYESTLTGVRNHDGTGEPRTVEQYRNRHALYRSDPDLQAAHRMFPWIVTWDDHEVDNNYAGLTNDGAPDPDFAARRAAAYLVYYEHMPIRALTPKSEFFKIFRQLDFGDLASFFVLDTRQYRSDQECNDVPAPECEGFPDPAGDMLGAEQEGWLVASLGASPSIWNVLAQQVVFSPTPIVGIRNYDQWDGYPVARQRVLDFLRNAAVRNVQVLTGDIHSSGAAAVPVSEQDLATFIGSEWVATGISSIFGNPVLASIVEQAIGSLPHIKFFDAQNQGYVRHEVTRTQWRADFRFVETILEPVSAIATGKSFVVQDGAPEPIEI